MLRFAGAIWKWGFVFKMLQHNFKFYSNSHLHLNCQLIQIRHSLRSFPSYAHWNRKKGKQERKKKKCQWQRGSASIGLQCNRNTTACLTSTACVTAFIISLLWVHPALIMLSFHFPNPTSSWPSPEAHAEILFRVVVYRLILDVWLRLLLPGILFTHSNRYT